MKESHEKCPSCKGKVPFLCLSPRLISQLTGVPSRNDVSSNGLQNSKSTKASGDTNSEEDLCIPAIYVKSCDPWLEPVNTNKQTNEHTWPPPALRPRSPGAGRAARRRRRGPGDAASRSGGPPQTGSGGPRFCPTKKERYFQLKFQNNYSWEYVIFFNFDKGFFCLFLSPAKNSTEIPNMSLEK